MPPATAPEATAGPPPPRGAAGPARAVVAAARPARPASTGRTLRALSDAELVARFRAGEDEPFAEIYRRHRGALVAFAGRLLARSGHDAEDAVQDAFVRAHRALRASAGAIALRPWLYAIVRNRALDDLRSAPPPAAAADAGAATCDAVQRALLREALRELVAGIGGLPERQRTALVLRELDGRSHAETARRMGTSVPATKSLLVRARARLATLEPAA